MSRSVFEQTPSSIAGDLHDSVSLLWRLELAGRSPRERWRPFTAIARERMNRQGLHFHVAHMAMALAAGGDWAGAEQHLGIARERAPKDRTRSGRRRGGAARRGAARLRGRRLRAHDRAPGAACVRGSSSWAAAARSATCSTTRCSRRASAPATPSGPAASWPSAWPVAPITSGAAARRERGKLPSDAVPPIARRDAGPAIVTARPCRAGCSSRSCCSPRAPRRCRRVLRRPPPRSGSRCCRSTMSTRSSRSTRASAAGSPGWPRWSSASAATIPPRCWPSPATRSHPRWRPPCCRAGT